MTRLGDRSQFPDLEVPFYFNHAAMSPPSLAVHAAVRRVVDDYAQRGAAAWMTWAEQREGLRARLARMIGAAAEDVALVPNTSHGVVDVALAIRWRPGDRIVSFVGEFPTNVTPWQRAASRFGLHIVFHDAHAFLSQARVALEHLHDELRRGVRVVTVSAVQFQTGLRMPLEEIGSLCRAFGAELFVDGIQAVGAMPLDVGALGIDYLACGGHKWLMGIEGSGFLYVSPKRIGELDPLVAGWLSHEDGVGFLFKGAGHMRYDRPLRRRADVFEIGVASSVGFAALDASTALLEEIGPARILEHVQSILDPLEEGLVARGFWSARRRESSERSCILSTRPPHGVDLAELSRELALRGVACATPDGFLRFAPHWPNDPRQVEPTLRALDAALAALR